MIPHARSLATVLGSVALATAVAAPAQGARSVDRIETVLEPSLASCNSNVAYFSEWQVRRQGGTVLTKSTCVQQASGWWYSTIRYRM